MQVEEFLAHARPCVEIVVQGQPGELAQEVDRIVMAVGGVMQYGVGVGEDLLGGDGVIGVVFAEALQTPLRDVADVIASPPCSGRGGGIGMVCEVQVM